MPAEDLVTLWSGKDENAQVAALQALLPPDLLELIKEEEAKKVAADVRSELQKLLLSAPKEQLEARLRGLTRMNILNLAFEHLYHEYRAFMVARQIASKYTAATFNATSPSGNRKVILKTDTPWRHYLTHRLSLAPAGPTAVGMLSTARDCFRYVRAAELDIGSHSIYLGSLVQITAITNECGLSAKNEATGSQHVTGPFNFEPTPENLERIIAKSKVSTSGE